MDRTAVAGKSQTAWGSKGRGRCLDLLPSELWEAVGSSQTGSSMIQFRRFRRDIGSPVEGTGGVGLETPRRVLGLLLGVQVEDNGRLTGEQAVKVETSG